MFSMCSELTPRAHIPDTRIPQLMQPCPLLTLFLPLSIPEFPSPAPEAMGGTLSGT